jgi:hypothetical protein
VTISNENGTLWLGGITEFRQYRDLLEWAIASKDAGELQPLPNAFRGHSLFPFRNFSTAQGLCLLSGKKAAS